MENFNPDDYSEKYLHWRMEDLPIIPTQWKLKVESDAAKAISIEVGMQNSGLATSLAIVHFGAMAAIPCATFSV